MPSHRQAYQVMLEEGVCSTHIGWKGRLLSYRRACKVSRFLRKRGFRVRVRYFGQIALPEGHRLFDV